MRVGLFGGSFNPPHEGHALVARAALRRLGLHRLWWIVSPGSPLKSGHDLLPLSRRLALSEALGPDPRIQVTAFEAAFGLRYTVDTIALVTARNPGVDFVWVMGADALADFHRWRRWRGIAAQVPLAVIDRPGATLAALSSPAARSLWRARLAEARAGRLAGMTPPAWTLLTGPRSPLSSTALRKQAAPAKSANAS